MFIGTFLGPALWQPWLSSAVLCDGAVLHGASMTSMEKGEIPVESNLRILTASSAGVLRYMLFMSAVCIVPTTVIVVDLKVAVRWKCNLSTHQG